MLLLSASPFCIKECLKQKEEPMSFFFVFYTEQSMAANHSMFSIYWQLLKLIIFA